MTEVLPKSFAGKTIVTGVVMSSTRWTTLCDRCQLEIVGMVVGHLFPAANLGKVSLDVALSNQMQTGIFAFGFSLH